MSVTVQQNPEVRDSARREAVSIHRRNLVASETVSSLPATAASAVDFQFYNRAVLLVDINDSTFASIITYWWDGSAWFEGASKTVILDDGAFVLDDVAGRQMWVLLTYLTAGTTALTGAIAMDGAVPTDETAGANNAAANDMPLLPAIPVQNDAYYFGGSEPFGKLTLNIGTQGDGTWTITWEYYNGTTWVALSSITDGTTGFKAAVGNHDVTYTVPSDWASVSVGGVTAYYIRGRVSAYTAITTQPLGTQAWLVGGVTLSYAPY